MNLLSIGGSDPSSGAGIQRDLITFGAYGAHGLTVVTTVTSQNTSKFDSAEAVSPKMLKAQLDSVMDGFEISGIKVGMVYTSQIILSLYSKLLKAHDHNIPIVVDPVIKSTTGGNLLEKSALDDFVRYIVPLADVITPNYFEAQIIVGASTHNDIINTRGDPPMDTAEQIRKMGAKAVVITGLTDYTPQNKKIIETVSTIPITTSSITPRNTDNTTTIPSLQSPSPPLQPFPHTTTTTTITDLVVSSNDAYTLSTPVIHKTTHGSGCSYSASLLCSLASGAGLVDSITSAKKFALMQITNSNKMSSMTVPAIHMTSVASDPIRADLLDTIGKLVCMPDMYKHIPECQTNFVYASAHPVSIYDILGVSGRLVRAGTRIVMAGGLEYGGSKHVATALLAVSERFPQIRSAINIKYRDVVISKINDIQMQLAMYDRQKEPIKTKFGKGGSSISWGVTECIKDLNQPPDAIYHTGDFGKEPMIILFGYDPLDVFKKIMRIS